MRQLVLASFFSILLPACAGDDGPGPADSGVPDAQTPDVQAPDAAPANAPGKHVHELVVDGMTREVIVYVPELAAGQIAAPAVLMLHGTSGDGERFYNISGWREKADAEGLIAVFPSALTYCLKEDDNLDGDFDDPGETKVTTKWASGELGTATMPLCTPAEVAMLTPANQALVDHPLADDVAFIDAILGLLSAAYVTDANRIYASGFSNGGGMTSRLALERADRFAAVAASAGGLRLDPVPAARPLSFVFTVGTLDDRFLAVAGLTSFTITDTLFTDVPLLQLLIDRYLTMLQLGPGFVFDEMTIAGKRVGRYVFAESTTGAGNRFTFLLIEDCTHQYPNGTNHPIVITNPLWNFFSSQALP